MWEVPKARTCWVPSRSFYIGVFLFMMLPRRTLPHLFYFKNDFKVAVTSGMEWLLPFFPLQHTVIGAYV